MNAKTLNGSQVYIGGNLANYGNDVFTLEQSNGTGMLTLHTASGH